MTLLFERGSAGEGTGEIVSLDLKEERWQELSGTRVGEAARPGTSRVSSGKGAVSRACPPSPYHLLWLPTPRVPPGGSSPLLLFQKTGV